VVSPTRREVKQRRSNVSIGSAYFPSPPSTILHANESHDVFREVLAYKIPGGSSEIMNDIGVRQSVKIAQIMGAKL